MSSNFVESGVPGTLITAYRATHYCVTGVTEPFVLRVDARSDDLARCHAAYGVTTSAFLTAFNPHSQPTPDSENDAAQRRLTDVIRARPYAFLDGLGVDPTGDWPAEPSLLVLGIPLADAHALGAEFAQNGFVWSSDDAVPRLVLLR